MSYQAIRCQSRQSLIQKYRVRDALDDCEVAEPKIFLVEGRVWESACEVFPSLLNPEDDMGAIPSGDWPGAWTTYASSRVVMPENSYQSGWVWFGEDGSWNAAWQLVMVMQRRGCKGKIEFCDGSWMRLEDAVIPGHFAWEYRYEWHDEVQEEKEIAKLIEAAIAETKAQAAGFRYLGDGYWESTNPNDYTFYETSMLPEEALDPQVDEEAIAARVREQCARLSPYAKVFQRALDD